MTAAITKSAKPVLCAVFCSFCGRRDDSVFYIVPGPKNIGICDECVELCRDAIHEQRGKP